MINIFLALVLTAAMPPFEVQTLDGKTLVGTLVELTADRLSLDAAGGRVSLETDNLLSLSAARKPAPARFTPGVVVELIDGSTILGRQFTARADRSTITLLDGEVLETPANAVRTVRFQYQSLPSPSGKGAAGEADLSAEWSRLAGMKVQSDLLVIYKEQTIDYLKGVLHDVTDDVVRFDLDGEVLPVKRTKIHGLIYRRGAAADLPPPMCRITDASGSQWSAKTLSLAEKLHWTTLAGLIVSQPLEKIAKIDFSSGKLTYLSDLKPDSVAWTPLFPTAKPLPAMERFYAPRFDGNFDSSPLRLGGTPYGKGLALHCRTEIVYRLPAPFRRFRAVAGIDGAVRPDGHARLLLRGDDKVLFDAAIAGGNAPQLVDLDVTGIRRLTILVDFGDSPNAGDRLLLCNARLSQ